MQRLTNRHTVLASIVILVVLLAGCLTGIGGSQPQTTTTPAEPIEAASETPCVTSLAYYNVGNGSAAATSPDQVSIGYAIDDGASIVFVAAENETILGTSVTSAEYNSVADGHSITFDEQLDGIHTVHVSAYEDTNQNQEFDRGIDRPCYSNGEHVQTKKKTFNFSSSEE